MGYKFNPISGDFDIDSDHCACIKINKLDGATWTNQCHMNNLFASSGRATGGIISESGGVITIGSGTGFIKATDDDVGTLYSFDWAEETGFSVPINTIKYFGIEYNGGSPQVVEATSESEFDLDTSFALGQVINQNGEYYVLQNPWWVTDGITNIIERFESFGHLYRDAEVGGLIPGYSGVRYLTMSGGTIWSRLTEHIIPNFTTVADVDHFDMYYRDSETSWSETELFQWDNTQYNPITGVNAYTLQPIPNNQYSVIWVWVNASSQKPSLIYPQMTYPSLAGAEAESVPEFPAMWYKGGLIIGRFICKEGIDDPIAVQSSYDSMFTNTAAADHGNLAGLSDDDHPQYWKSDGTSTATGDWDLGTYDLSAGVLNLESDDGATGFDAEDVSVVTSGDGGTGVEILGSDLVINGDFSSAEPPGTDWSRGAAWTIDGAGKAICDGAFSDGILAQTLPTLTPGAQYQITFDLDSVGGAATGVLVYLGGVSVGGVVQSTGTNTVYITTTAETNDFEIRPGAGIIVGDPNVTCQIDNVIIKEVTQLGDGKHGGDVILNLGAPGSPVGGGAVGRYGGLYVNSFIDVPDIQGLDTLTVSDNITADNITVGDDVTIANNLSIGSSTYNATKLYIPLEDGDESGIRMYWRGLTGSTYAPETGIDIDIDAFSDSESFFLRGVNSTVQTYSSSDIFSGVYGGTFSATRRAYEDTTTGSVLGGSFSSSLSNISGTMDVDTQSAISLSTVVSAGPSTGVVNVTDCYSINASSNLNAASGTVAIDNYYGFKLQQSNADYVTNNYGILLELDETATNNFGIALSSDDAGAGAIWFGAGQDSKIWYDGTDINIDPKVQGSGVLNILGDVDFNSSTLTNISSINGGTLSGDNSGDQDLSGYLLNTTDDFTGTLSITGSLEVDTLDLNGNVISDSTGTISFDDDNLTTTGEIISYGGISNNLGELLTDPSFDDSGEWELGTGWAVSGGNATHTVGAGTGTLIPATGIVPEVGETYYITLTLTTANPAAYVRVSIGGATGNKIYTTGTYMFVLTAANTDEFTIEAQGGAFVAQVLSDISVEKYLGDIDIGLVTMGDAYVRGDFEVVGTPTLGGLVVEGTTASDAFTPVDMKIIASEGFTSQSGGVLPTNGYDLYLSAGRGGSPFLPFGPAQDGGDTYLTLAPIGTTGVGGNAGEFIIRDSSETVIISISDDAFYSSDDYPILAGSGKDAGFKFDGSDFIIYSNNITSNDECLFQNFDRYDFDAPVKIPGYTVASLPASPLQGDTAFVTDATSPTYLGTLTGGGSTVCPVFYDGTNWVSH